MILIQIFLALLAAVVLISTVMPEVRTERWWVRGFDFPRVQVAVLMGLVLAGFFAVGMVWGFRGWFGALAGAVVIGLGWQLFRIWPYTLAHPVQVQDAEGADPTDASVAATSRGTSGGGDDLAGATSGAISGGGGGGIRLLISNVQFDNRNDQALRARITQTDPDLILLAEPTDWWDRQLAHLEGAYPHHVRLPQDNHYGLLLYSRLELVDPEVRHLADAEVPSIRTGVRLASGRVMTFYGMHPKPPGLKRPGYESERKDADERDAELMIVAREIAQSDRQPTLVAGDFNDVAWSHTTRLFQRVAGLLDPRIGRGMFNTFSTQSRFMRYPLDHMFMSEHFRLVRLRRLPSIGSDHFPMFAELVCEPERAPAQQDAPEPEGDDVEEARETMKQAGA